MPRFLALLILLPLAAWIGYATAVRRMPANVWQRPQPFPYTSRVVLTEVAPFAAASQKPLRNFLFARENRVTTHPPADVGIRTLTPGAMLTFLGADADMGWVRDDSGAEFWVPLASLRQ